jgi:hypothetical protein
MPQIEGIDATETPALGASPVTALSKRPEAPATIPIVTPALIASLLEIDMCLHYPLRI